MAIVTQADVEAQLGRTLTPAEATRMTSRLASWTDMLENVLHRGLEIEQRVVEKQPVADGSSYPSAASGFSTLGQGYNPGLPGAYGLVWLDKPPVHSVSGVVDVPTGVDITAACVREGERLIVPTLNRVTVTYVSGDDPVQPEVADTMLTVLLRMLFLPANVAAGLNPSYSVEGLSVNYGVTAATDTNAVGPFTGAELKALKGGTARMLIR